MAQSAPIMNSNNPIYIYFQTQVESFGILYFCRYYRIVTQYYYVNMIIWLFDFLNIFDMLTFVTFSIRGQSTSPINSLSTVADMKHFFRFITKCYTISIIDIIKKCTNSEVALKKYAHFANCLQTLLNTLYTFFYKRIRISNMYQF